MPQSAADILSDAKSAMVHADEMEALHKTAPVPVPEGLKPVAKAASTTPPKHEYSDAPYSMVQKLKSHKSDVDEAIKASQ